ncbi:MAG TPA: helix-turn-helix domain-containing protein [Streptosporangiaceae bacterium]|jgi:DNA-binding HxlR family transcriptional regulator
MLGKDYQQQDCALARALEVVGERWTLLIVRDAFLGVRHFNDFQVHLDISKGVLAERLTGLIEAGIMARRQDPQHAGRSVYELTTAGRDLWPALHALLMWGDRYRYPNSRLFKHAACGTTLDASAYCVTCQLAPKPEDIVTEMRPGRRGLRDDPVTIALRVPHRLMEPVVA